MKIRATAEIKAGTEGLERRLRYKVIRYRKGLCVNCSSPREESPFKRLCEACGDAKNRKRRKKTGSRAWKPGSPGRPPLRSLIKKDPS